MTSFPSSVLLIGATGRLGLDVLHELTSLSSKPQVHAFCRDAAKLSSKDSALCTSVVQGNARNQKDIEKALAKTNADIVIISIGNGDNVGKTDIRAASALALAGAMQKPEYNHVRATVVSSSGAGSSRIVVGFGVGKLVEMHLRHVLKDHTNQEAAMKSVIDRTDIVRPTALTNDKATGKVQEFGDKQKCPNLECDRKDVAKWIAEDMYRPSFGGKVVNIASKK